MANIKCTNVYNPQNLTSIKTMNKELYNYLQDGVLASYAQSAYKMALGMLKMHRKLRRKGKNPKIPYMKRDCIKLNNQNYKIKNGNVRISLRAREFVYIKLEKHTLDMLKGVKHGSLTITPRQLIFSYSKIITKTTPHGWAGLDINFNNSTLHDTNGNTTIEFMINRLEKNFRKNIGITYGEVKAQHG